MLWIAHDRFEPEDNAPSFRSSESLQPRRGSVGQSETTTAPRLRQVGLVAKQASGSASTLIRSARRKTRTIRLAEWRIVT